MFILVVVCHHSNSNPNQYNIQEFGGKKKYRVGIENLQKKKNESPNNKFNANTYSKS